MSVTQSGLVGIGGCFPDVAIIGTNDASLSISSTLLAVLSAALAGYKVSMALDAMSKELDIANRYLSIAKSWRAYYNDIYKDLENRLVDEVYDIPIETPDLRYGQRPCPCTS